jgi:hypothetical protein
LFVKKISHKHNIVLSLCQRKFQDNLLSRNKELHKRGIFIWHKFVKVSQLSSLVMIICWNDITKKNILRQKSAKTTFNQFIEIKTSKPSQHTHDQTHKGKKKQLRNNIHC